MARTGTRTPTSDARPELARGKRVAAPVASFTEIPRLAEAVGADVVVTDAPIGSRTPLGRATVVFNPQ